MIKGFRRLFLVSFLNAVLILTCAGGGILPENTESGEPSQDSNDPSITTSNLFSADPNPVSIDIELESGSSTSVMIGPEGGSLSATDSKGFQYSLHIPENALMSPEDITMTPIASAKGEAIGDSYLAGVNLQPKGLHFLGLVELSIRGKGIENSSLGFSSVQSGQDLHLVPSEASAGVLAIRTNHFSDFGAAAESILDSLDEVVPTSPEARFLHNLFNAEDAEAIEIFAAWIDRLQEEGDINNHEEWVHWTMDVFSLYIRFGEMIDLRAWDEDPPPGLENLVEEVAILLNQWFSQSDAVMLELAEVCSEGSLTEAFLKMKQILTVGDWFSDQFYSPIDNTVPPEWVSILERWDELLENCTCVNIAWQANVETIGGDFYSDISIGAEVGGSERCATIAPTDAPLSSSFSGVNSTINIEGNTLEVEYIQGFWDNVCEPTPGSLDFSVSPDWEIPNLGGTTAGGLVSLYVKVKIVEDVYIDCSQSGFDMTADAQYPFHGGPLDRVNEDRVEEGWWTYELIPDPGAGVLAQFEEGPEEIPSQGGGKYNVWQLITVWPGTAPD